MANSSNAKSIRFNPDKDKELLEYLNENGMKPGIKKLFNFYKEHQQNKDIELIIKSSIKDALGNISIERPTTKSFEQQVEKRAVGKLGAALFGSMKAK